VISLVVEIIIFFVVVLIPEVLCLVSQLSMDESHNRS